MPRNNSAADGTTQQLYEVSAHLEPAAGISSLEDVALGLVRDSLESRASEVEVNIDFMRGSCTVEDDGTNIGPQELTGACNDARYSRHESAVAKSSVNLQQTSHLQETPRCGVANANGRHVSFLLSIAGLGHVTIISRTTVQHPLNVITFDHSNKPEANKQVCEDEKNYFRKSGTRVEVRHLFSNVGIRTRHHAPPNEQTHRAKEWIDVKHSMVTLALSWSTPVTLVVRSTNAAEELHLLYRPYEPSTKLHPTFFSKLSILTQASLISRESWSNWEPVATSSSSVSLQGALSLEASPSKLVQFICIDNEPILTKHRYSFLFDEINQFFASSTFGAAEMNSIVHDAGSRDIVGQGRLRSDKITQKLRKSDSKGVDRWPMYFFLITLTQEKSVYEGVDPSFGAMSSKIKRIVKSTVKEWLKQHHFTRVGPETAPADLTQRRMGNNSRADQGSKTDHLDKLTSPAREKVRRRPGEGIKTIMKSPVAFYPRHTQTQSFGTWSRVRSGETKPVCNTSSQLKIPTYPKLQGDTDAISVLHHSSQLSTFVVGDVHASSKSENPRHEYNESPHSSRTELVSLKGKEDSIACEEPLIWNHPMTGQRLSINKRSGDTRLVKASLGSSASFRDNGGVLSPPPGLVQRFDKMKSEEMEDIPARKAVANLWLTSLVKQWRNPILETGEIPIQQAKASAPDSNKEKYKPGNCPTNISLASLRKAEVISQLDGKFILLKMVHSTFHTNNRAELKTTLAIVDQHAADERCKVEKLFEELCEVPEDIGNVDRSAVGHDPGVRAVHLDDPLVFDLPLQEIELLTAQASLFARWGVLYYTARKLCNASATRSGQVVVNALPPCIVERCIARPKLLEDLLRTEAWARAEGRGSYSKAKIAAADQRLQGKASERQSWLRRIGDCPQGIVDMLNSRACRSAIMFNDDLSRNECKDLMRRLSVCAFPFQCAHGRPSMVPLVNLGHDMSNTASSAHINLDGSPEDVQEEGFIAAFRKWQP